MEASRFFQTTGKFLSLLEVTVGKNGREYSDEGPSVERGLKHSYRMESQERMSFGDKCGKVAWLI